MFSRCSSFKLVKPSRALISLTLLLASLIITSCFIFLSGLISLTLLSSRSTCVKLVRLPSALISLILLLRIVIQSSLVSPLSGEISLILLSSILIFLSFERLLKTLISLILFPSILSDSIFFRPANGLISVILSLANVIAIILGILSIPLRVVIFSSSIVNAYNFLLASSLVITPSLLRSSSSNRALYKTLSGMPFSSLVITVCASSLAYTGIFNVLNPIIRPPHIASVVMILGIFLSFIKPPLLLLCVIIACIICYAVHVQKSCCFSGLSGIRPI